MGLTKVLQNKLQNKVHEAKEKVNPYSTTNKNNRVEAKKQQVEERKAEREAYHKERAHQIEERGRQKAKHEFGSSSKKGKSVRGYVNHAGSVPMFRAVDPMSALIGSNKKPKQRTPTKTTTVTTGNKTIRITEKVSEEEQQKKPRPQYDFPDVLGFSTEPTPRRIGKKEPKPFDPFAEFM